MARTNMQDDITFEKVPHPDHSAAIEKTLTPLRRRVLSPLVCTICAGLGIFGGLSAIFAGLICVAIHAALRPETAFDRVSTVLLVIGIPMMLVGSFFMDEIKYGNTKAPSS